MGLRSLYASSGLGQGNLLPQCRGVAAAAREREHVWIARQGDSAGLHRALLVLCNTTHRTELEDDGRGGETKEFPIE